MSKIKVLGPDVQPQGFGGALEKIAPKSDESVLDRPVGPTPQCYSIRHMVNLFRWGASEPDVNHLTSCEPCRTWANNYASSPNVRVARDQRALRSWRTPVAAWLKRSSPPVDLTPILYVMNPAVNVAPTGVSMDVALVAGVTDPKRLDVDSLKLEGQLFSNRATLVTQEIAGSDYPVVRFEDIQMVKSLRRDVQNHTAVIQNVCVTGRLQGGEQLTFRGQANVHVREARVGKG